MIAAIPLEVISNQRVTLSLGGKNTTIVIYSLEDSTLYADIYIDSDLIIAGARCNTGVALNQYPTSMIGYLVWVTTDGYDPTWQQIGTTAQLLWSDENLAEQIYQKWINENV